MYHSVLMNQDLTTDLNQDRLEHIRTTVDAYLHNRIMELNILNVAEATEAFKVFRSIVNAIEDDRYRDIHDTTDSRASKAKSASKSNSRTSLRVIILIITTNKKKIGRIEYNNCLENYYFYHIF